MIPLVGAFLGGSASGLLGGAASSGFFNGLLGSLMNGSSGGLFGMLNSLFSGSQPTGGDRQTNELLVDIKEMLGRLLDQKGGAEGYGGCHQPTPEQPSYGCGVRPDSECNAKPQGCGGTNEAVWDGEDKSPSLDREHGAARLLEQAKNTDDPKEKRELIEIALELLQEGDDSCGCDGNSYDKDIVEQAKRMLEKIDDSCLSDCGKSKAIDSVIDLLNRDGGVDGKPADNGLVHGWRNDPDHNLWGARPLPIFHSH